MCESNCSHASFAREFDCIFCLWAGEKQEEVTPLTQIPLLLTAQPSPQQYYSRTGEPWETGESVNTNTLTCTKQRDKTFVFLTPHVCWLNYNSVNLRWNLNWLCTCYLLSTWGYPLCSYRRQCPSWLKHISLKSLFCFHVPWCPRT